MLVLFFVKGGNFNVENKTNHEEEEKEQKNENMTQLEKLQLALKKAIKEEKYTAS